MKTIDELMKLYKPAHNDQIQIIDGEFPSFEQFFLVPAANNEPHPESKCRERMNISIIDLDDQKNKILSVPRHTHQAIADALDVWVARLQSERLLASQAYAARRFKQSKLLYRS